MYHNIYPVAPIITILMSSGLAAAMIFSMDEMSLTTQIGNLLVFILLSYQFFEYVKLGEEDIIIVKGFFRRKLEYKKILSVRLGDYYSILFKYPPPGMNLFCEGRKKSVPINYKLYKDEQLKRIVDEIKCKNSNVDFCENIEVIFRNTKPK